MPNPTAMPEQVIAMPAAALLAALACIACRPVLADEPAAADSGSGPGQVLPDIVVTATRGERPAFEVPGAIDAVRVDGGASLGVNPSEFLQGIPGLLTRDRQNYAQDEQISIRGFGARSTFGVRGVRLYVDGIPATMPDGQGQVSNFPLGSAARIEVLRGPFSALYGNSSGGVIQIFSADGGERPELRFDAAGGSYGTLRLGANARGREGNVDYNVDLSQFHTDGYRGHGYAERTNANAKFTVDFGEGRKLTLLANAVALPNADDPLGLTRAQFETDPRQPVAGAAQFDTRKSVHQQQGGAIWEQPLGDAQRLRVLGYAGHRNVEQFQAIPVATQKATTSPGGVIDLDGDYGGGDLRWSYKSTIADRPFDLSVGVSYDRQNQHRLGYNNYLGSTLGVKGALRRDEQNLVSNFDEYVQATWSFGERWLASIGARHSQVKFSADDHYVVKGNPDDSGRADYAATTPVAGLLYRAGEHWHLYASYGKGFETPTFNELGYRPDGSAGINFGLVPARSRNGEVGSKWRFANGGEFDAALFQANTRNEIAVANSSGGRTAYQNVDRARRRGAEFKLDLPLAAGWRAQLAYTWLDAEFLSPFLTCPAASTCTTPNTPVAAGARIPGVPRSNLYAALRWGEARGWNATIAANAASATPVNDLNTQYAPGYATLGIGAGYAFETRAAKISMFLRLDNLFDRNYAGSVIVNESNGRYFEPAPGRNVFAGLHVAWKP
ncbi:TonB-dependent receptor [Rudaea sp.]|uniref:TonB-dependent receptor family protein n=1 Tax=Rudaea sp. TaxID=2136325 RepID=UPI0032209987